VEFPDPENRRFKLVRVEGGHFVPIVDREVLRQQIGGHKVYFGPGDAGCECRLADERAQGRNGLHADHRLYRIAREIANPEGPVRTMRI
jgi:hypothetical protein